MIKLRFSSLILLLLTASVSESLAQQEYQIPEIIIEAEIQRNGTIEINESRHYQFQGSFSWADYRLPRDGFDEMRNIRVSEQGQDYQLTDNGEPGSYTVTESDDEIVITWHYEAVDTERTFTVSYELDGAILHGQEWSELFWTWIGSDREKSTADFEVLIGFPNELTADSLYYWSRTPEDLIEFSHEGSQLTLSGQNISRSQSIPVRILMPVTLFDSSTITNREAAIQLDRIIAEENEITEREKRRAERRAAVAELAPGITMLLSLFSIGIIIFLYQRFGKRHQTSTYSTVSTTMVPGRAEPALVGRLLSFYQTHSIHLTATLFDLARRGWFTLEEEDSEKKWYQSKPVTEFRVAATVQSPAETLEEWERMVVDYVNNRLRLGKSKLSEVFGSSDSETMKWYPTWSKEVKRAFKERKWKDEKSMKGVYLNLILQGLIVILSIILMVLGGMIGVVAMIISIIMLACSTTLIRRTKEGEEAYMRWKSYREGLKKADERILFKDRLDRHFVYAIAFGLREKELTKLIEIGSQHRDSDIFPWLFVIPGSGSTPITAAQNLSKHSALSVTSGSSVSGGGASVGAAGGGASGGAG
tara:strand:- start:22463 stop:24229 length:1767 start_codon:yes stop_codon:yes gene_type:complete